MDSSIGYSVPNFLDYHDGERFLLLFFYFPVLFLEILFQLRLWVGFGVHENQCPLSIHTYIQEILTCYLSGTCDNKENCGLKKYSQSNSWQSSSVQSLSHVWLFATPWTRACQASLSITNSRSLFKLISIESVMPSNHLILCRPLRLLPSIFPSNRVFSNDSVLCIRWPKYWSFSFNISPSSEHSGLTSLRIDWLDLLSVQRTLRNLLQHHSSKASILAVLGFLYSPTLTSIHDYWKNYSFDEKDLYW